MKIHIGTEIDSNHCRTIQHEYYKCRDAFERFTEIAEAIILIEQNNKISYRAYNAYSYFILHLYEFLMACHARDNTNTRITSKKGEKRITYLDSLLMEDAHKVVNARIDRINQGRAPSWENDVSYYQKLLPIPDEFGEKFRTYRNKVGGHATFERISELNLTQFYKKYHSYLYLLYIDIGEMWGRESKEFPDLKDVTNFLKNIKNE